MNRLPIVLSVSHAGLLVPDWLKERCLLSPEQIARDGDEGAAEIYSFGDRVASFVTTDVARAVVDMNRPEDDFGPDGVVKTQTCFGEPVWREPLDRPAVDRLLREVHRPYHRRLSAAPPEALFGVDAHTMCAVAPPTARDAGRPRPRVCLSDGGGAFPQPWFLELRRCFRETFGEDVRLNDPFRGGYITRAHGRERPWVQVELSRAAFASNDEKRDRVLAALVSFCRWLAAR